MFGRGLLRKIVTGGIIAAIGYLLIPRRRNRWFVNMKRWPLSQRDLWKIGRGLVRGWAR